MAADEQPAAQTWRDDPGWRLVFWDAEHYGDAEAPASPPDDAELAQPSVWASLYQDRRLVACWWRPFEQIAPAETTV